MAARSKARQRSQEETQGAVERFHEALALTLTPLRTISEANASQREHWATKHRRIKQQRMITFVWLRHLFGRQCPLRLPVHITLTRIAPSNGLDDDNLRSALKACRDGCADYLTGDYLTGQDRQQGLTWQYEQRRGKPKEYGVGIVFLPMPNKEGDCHD